MNDTTDHIASRVNDIEETTALLFENNGAGFGQIIELVRVLVSERDDLKRMLLLAKRDNEAISHENGELYKVAQTAVAALKKSREDERKLLETLQSLRSEPAAAPISPSVTQTMADRRLSLAANLAVIEEAVQAPVTRQDATVMIEPTRFKPAPVVQEPRKFDFSADEFERQLHELPTPTVTRITDKTLPSQASDSKKIGEDAPSVASIIRGFADMVPTNRLAKTGL